MGILEQKPSPSILALLRSIEDAGGEIWNPEVEMALVTEAKRLGLVESATMGTGGGHHLCLTPGVSPHAVASTRFVDNLSGALTGDR